MNDKDIAWRAIFDRYNIYEHDFDHSPYRLTASQIKEATKQFTNTGQREPRILCKQDSRESRPSIFRELGLFILPVKNGEYMIIKGEGYIDIPPITSSPVTHVSKLGFRPVTSLVGNSEMQHLDYAYAVSIIRTFMNDPSLVLTIRGRKYTPEFSFYVGHHHITVKSVQTEVDAGYEGLDQIVLVEAKNSHASNVIIRQLYYPFRQWMNRLIEHGVDKSVFTVFFERIGDEIHLWQFHFDDISDYNSIRLIRMERFIVED